MSRRIVRSLLEQLADTEAERDYLRRERDRLIKEQFKEVPGGRNITSHERPA